MNTEKRAGAEKNNVCFIHLYILQLQTKKKYPTN